MSPAVARKGLAATTPSVAPPRLPRRIGKLLSIAPMIEVDQAYQEAALDELDAGNDGLLPCSDPEFERFGWGSADYADLRADRLAAKASRLRRRGHT